VTLIDLHLGPRPDEPGPPISRGPQAYPAETTARLSTDAAQIMARYPEPRSALLPLLHLVQASYGLTLCAECGLVSDLVRTGGGRLVAVACVGGDGRPLMPCGRCRQLLWEHGGPDLLLETVSLGIVPMREVLPDAFGPADLTAVERGDR
jgi:hypothetical protein